MNKNSRVAASIAGLAVAALSLTACSGGATPEPTFTGTTGQITIGFSPMNQQAPALIGLAHGVEAVVTGGGDKFLLADPNNDPATQASQITAWITNKQIQGWWSLAASATSLTSVVKLAMENGVVGVVNGVPADYGFDGPQRGIAFSNIPYGKFGAAIGDGMAQCLASRGAGKSGEIIYVTSPAGQVGNDEQLAAIKDKIGSAGTIVAEVAGEANQATSQSVVASALQAHPNAIGILGLNDEATNGAVQAVKAAGMDPKAMCIVGGGGSEASLALVKSGEMYSVAALDFGGDLMQTIAKIKSMAANPNEIGGILETPFNNVVTEVNKYKM